MMPSRLTPVRPRKLGDWSSADSEKDLVGIFAPGPRSHRATLMANGVGAHVREASACWLRGLLEVRQGDGTDVWTDLGTDPLEYRLRRQGRGDPRGAPHHRGGNGGVAPATDPGRIEAMRECQDNKRAAMAPGHHGYVTADMASIPRAGPAATGFSPTSTELLHGLPVSRRLIATRRQPVPGPHHNGLLEAIAAKDPEKAVAFAMEALDRTTNDAKALEGA